MDSKSSAQMCSNVANPCHELSHTVSFKRKLQRTLIAKVNLGPNHKPAGCLFLTITYFQKNNPTSAFLTSDSRIQTQLCLRRCSARASDSLHPTISRAASFASSEYLWKLLSHIPLSGRVAGMGLPILSRCSRLPGSCALCPIAVYFAHATCVAGVIEKNERLKTVRGRQASPGRSIELKDEWLCQGYKDQIKSTNSPRWKHKSESK